MEDVWSAFISSIHFLCLRRAWNSIAVISARYYTISLAAAPSERGPGSVSARSLQCVRKGMEVRRMDLWFTGGMNEAQFRLLLALSIISAVNGGALLYLAIRVVRALRTMAGRGT